MLSISQRALAPKELFCNAKTGKTAQQNHLLVDHGQPEGRPAMAARSAPSRAPHGLVYSQTSDTATPKAEKIPVSARINRLRRLRSSVITAARLHAESKSKWRVLMITPTYAPENHWNPGDITKLLKCIRQHLTRRGIEFRYVWVMEYTKKGKPHYHLLVWLPIGVKLPMPDSQGWWTKGWTKIEWARNAVGYIAKYTSKGSELEQYAPRARHHGNGGMTGTQLLEQRWWKLPGWLRSEVTPADQVKRRSGGGYYDPNTGEIHESPWEVLFEYGQVFIRLKG